MFDTVSAYMDGNKAIWSSNKSVADTVNDLNAAIAIVDDKSGKQAAPTAGATDDKDQTREAYEDKILEVGDQVAAMAAKNHDVVLGAQVNFTRAGVQKMASDELEKTGNRVSAAAAANMAALAEYDILPADVTELDGLTAKFNEVKTGPRAVVVKRAGETKTLPEAINNVTGILRDRLDRQMTKFRKTQPEFYAGYQSARVVVNRSGKAATPPAPPTPPAAPVK